MTVADLVEGLEEWKEKNLIVVDFHSFPGLKNPDYLKMVEYELREAEQKIKTAIREICNE